MRLRHYGFVLALLAALALLLPAAASAQTSTEPEGKTVGNFNVQQSVEVGVRFADSWQKGNPSVYNSFVNLHEGPRVLESTFFMRSLDRNAPVFDDLFVSTFGFGGDPNNVARMKISKNKAYDFTGMFRRDQNFFDYPQLGNPLNPTTGYPVPANTFLGVTKTTVNTPQLSDSAHPFAVRRRMSDFGLTILPQSIVTFRLGYSHLRMTGPSYTSFHEGTDFAIGGGGDNTSVTGNTYRMGVDFKVLPKTTLSYDQTFDYFKNDTGYALSSTNYSFTTWAPAGYTAQSINFGLPFYGAPLNRPCANFFVNSAMLVNPNCSGLYPVNPISNLPGYYRYQRVRGSTPTEQFSFVSRAIPHVDLSGHWLYSNAEVKSPFTEDFYGAVTRTQERRFGSQVTSLMHSVNNNAEFSATIHLTEKLRLVEIFRFNAWRLPVVNTLTEWSQVPGVIASGTSVLPGQTGFTPFLLLPIVGAFTPAQAATQPQSAFGAHSSSTGADWGTVTTADFLGQNAKWNTIQLEYDFVKSMGMRLGYRYGTRTDAEKSGYESGTEYYYPNPNGVGTGLAAARRSNCSTTIPDGVTQSIAANGVCTATIATPLGEPELFDITEHSALFGLWWRPNRNIRFNGELELTSASAAITRVSPRNQQHYRFRTTYQINPAAVISVSYNGIESSNPGVPVPALPTAIVIGGVSTPTVPAAQPNTFDINYEGHSRNFGISTSYNPNPKFGIDVAYNFTDFAQNNNVCPVYANTTSSTVTGTATTVWPGLPVCPLFPDQVADGTQASSRVGGKVVSAYNLANGKFATSTHFISIFVNLRPTKRLGTQFGYTLARNTGDMLVMSPWLGVGTPVLNPNPGANNYLASPNTFGAPGTLDSSYHTPLISISYDVAKNWTAKALWTYYGYGERALAPGIPVPNNFHANLATLSLRYAF